MRMLITLMLLCGCNDGAVGDTVDDTDDTDTDTDTAMYDLSFDGSDFAGAHGGQDFTMAVVECSTSECDPASATGVVVAETDGAVPTTTEWAHTFTGALLDGEDYELHLWIDSNFNGGSAGTCDAPDIDHQWGFDVGIATEDATVEVTHDPGATSPVCGTFTDSDDGTGGGGGGGGGGGY